MTTKATATAAKTVTIKPANLRTVQYRIVGTAPYVQSKFSNRVIEAMIAKMAQGSTANSKKARPPRDFDEDLRQATHFSVEGWNGIPAGAFRQAMISACRLVGFKMTLAKLSIFVEADGFDRDDGMPLVRIHGEPQKTAMAARNDNGSTDIRVRPMWREWHADVRIRYDADQFNDEDVTNLLQRVGAQVGIGEGRPDSRSSSGVGWGTFKLQ